MTSRRNQFAGQVVDDLQAESTVHADPNGLVVTNQAVVREYIDWDSIVPGLGQRFRPSRHPVWILQWKTSGKTFRRTLGPVSSLTQEAARHAALELRAQVHQQPTGSNPRAAPTFDEFGRLFFKDCAGRWKPRTRTDHAALFTRVLHEAFGRQHIDTINRADVLSWFQGPSGGCNRSLSVLSAIMQHAETLGLRAEDTNPCRGLRRKKTTFEAYYPRPEDYKAIGLALDQTAANEQLLADALRFVALTGARCGEAFNLQWPHIQGARAVLPDSKTGPKTIWLARSARELLGRIARSEHCPYVFGGTAQQSRLGKFWRTLRRSIGLDQVRIHDLRHGFASVGVCNGEDLQTIAHLLGHSDFNTTLGYAHLVDAPIVAAARRVSLQLAGAMTLQHAVERIPRPKLRRTSRARH